MTARVVRDDDAGRSVAIEVLRSGGVVALPTDTVYGIAVALETRGGIERLFQVKQRPLDKAIALLLGSAEQAATIGTMTPTAEALAAACWPGGLTVVLDQRQGAPVPLPDVLTAGTTTIGVRVPDHPAPRALAAAVGPLPTTSANVSGQPEARDATEIVHQLGASIDLILDGGPSRPGPASTVVDCAGPVPRILRLGAIAPERIAAILDAAGIAHGIPSS
jgi:L-threonylcarbamoyladenylate synthase